MWLLQCLQAFSLFFWPSDLVFDPAWPSFEIDRGIIGTNLLTKFHEARKRNVAPWLFTNQMWTTDRRTADKDRSQKVTKAIRWAKKSVCFFQIKSLNCMTNHHKSYMARPGIEPVNPAVCSNNWASQSTFQLFPAIHVFAFSMYM